MPRKPRDCVNFKIDTLPVSENEAVRMTSRGGYKTKKFREWEKVVGSQEVKVINKSRWYGVEIIFYFPLYYKNGNIRRKDAQNMIKYAIDTVLRKVVDSDSEEIDDCRILEGDFSKVDSDQNYVDITFYCIS